MRVYEKFKIEQWADSMLIGTFPSIQYTAHKLGMSARTIRESIKHNREDYRGYTWIKKYP